MTPAVYAALAVNHGLITNRQAVAAGLAPEDVDTLVKSGAWVAVRRGVYAEREAWEQLDSHRDRPKWRSRAASLNMVTPHVLSHDSAGLELGMDLLLPDPFMPHVTRPGVLGSRTKSGVKHHKAVFHPCQVLQVNRFPVLDLARTAVDIAREHGSPYGVVACDAALRLGASRHQLELALEPMRNWPHVKRARAAVDLADPGAESVGETLARTLVEELGIGRPQTQFGLTDGRREAWCDLRVGRHVFEFDGRIKYQRPQDGGVATRAPDEVVWHEKQRQDWVCGFGLGMSRIVWADFWGENRRWARQRLAREYAQTLSRYGDSLDGLDAFIIRRPRR
jgi:Transcriptional regulator, AbiEi antitoxin